MISSISSSNYVAEAYVTAANPAPGRTLVDSFLQRSGTGFGQAFVTRSDGGIGINAYIAGGTGPSGVLPVSQTQFLVDDPEFETPALPVRTIFPNNAVGSFGGLSVNEAFPVVALSFHYNINPYFVVTGTVDGGSVSATQSQAMLQTSIGSTGSAYLESRQGVRYNPGQGVVARFTAMFTTGAAGDCLQEVGLGDAQDGFFFAVSGSSLGIVRRRGGVDEFISQSAWNGPNRYDGTPGNFPALRPDLGNVYQIRYQWLGYGTIRFFVEDPSNGRLDCVHSIRYSNANTIPSVFNPTLPLHARVLNRGNTSNLVVFTPSMGAYTEGPPPVQGIPGSSGSIKTTLTTETPIISIQVTSTFQGLTNRVRVTPRQVTFTALAGVSVFRVLLNPTLTSASFVPFDAATSVVSLDRAATSASGGREVYRTNLPAKNSTNPIDLESLDLFLNPGDVLTYVSNADAEIDVQWHELTSG